MENFRDASTVESMSNEEAEEVVARFTQRQKEIQERLSMPTVNDLSEALNADPRELQAILGEIRASQNTPPLAVAPAEAKARKILPFAIIGVILVVGAAILLPLQRSVSAPNEVAITDSVPMAAETALAPSAYQEGAAATAVEPAIFPGQIPSFLSLTVDGAKLTGTGYWSHVEGASTAELERRVQTGIKAMIIEYAPASRTAIPGQIEEQRIRDMLNQRENNSYFRFIPITATFAGETVQTTVPVMNTSNLESQIMVQDAQDREIKLFANKVGQLYDRVQKTNR